jgi:hypothetical protein
MGASQEKKKKKKKDIIEDKVGHYKGVRNAPTALMPPTPGGPCKETGAATTNIVYEAVG